MNTSLSQLPCVNCLTLGMCKAFYKGLSEENSVGFNLLRINMSKRCCIFEEWLLENDRYYETNARFHYFLLDYENEQNPPNL